MTILSDQDEQSLPAAPGGVLTNRPAPRVFEVHLDAFSGPFEVLLALIGKHRLDITEIALAQVTDEFIAHIRAAQDADEAWDLSQASHFLLVAATLLDLKAARLLPHNGEEDEEDLALLEARDLLFARLLQYRAYKLVAGDMGSAMETRGRIYPRGAGLEPRFAALLPELIFGLSPEQFAALAVKALTPKPPVTVGVEHLHAPAVSVREQAAIVVARLRERGVATFAELVADAEETLVVVARFLGLLDLFRERAVAFEQPEALGELTVRWTGSSEGDITVTDEFDELDNLENRGNLENHAGVGDHEAVGDRLSTPLTGEAT